MAAMFNFNAMFTSVLEDILIDVENVNSLEIKKREIKIPKNQIVMGLLGFYTSQR
jgi:hypothetical protein